MVTQQLQSPAKFLGLLTQETTTPKQFWMIRSLKLQSTQAMLLAATGIGGSRSPLRHPTNN
ncbi:hypothetical protein [Neosynechococcus sphagnicola]|uniref:hypothetical protein n=1 Tax=Neosynechococcus sphagnicola TaxID=1501145 RepID=UPI0012DFF4FC|nr:hypothetical protein [Neosynechococcus sphagnicola]